MTCVQTHSYKPPVENQVCVSQGAVFAHSRLYILVVFAERCVIEKINIWISFIHFPVSFLILYKGMIFFFSLPRRFTFNKSWLESSRRLANFA
jgi:hypothetical protein